MIKILYLNVEIEKEAEEHKGVEAHSPEEDFREIAVKVQSLCAVYKHNAKLDHLHRCQMLLPPNVLLVFGSHGGNQVISVHNNMHRGIEEAEEGAVTTRGEFHTPPNSSRHDTVVNDVQCRDLIIFLTQNEEDSVEKLGELAEIIPPAKMGHYQLIRIIRVVDWLAYVAVVAQPSVFHSLEQIKFN